MLGAWLGLAVARVHALSIVVIPALAPEYVQQCDAVQRRVFGRETLMLTFSH